MRSAARSRCNWRQPGCHAPLAGFARYATRLPDEFALLAFRDALAVQPKLVALPAVQQWIAKARGKGLFVTSA